MPRIATSMWFLGESVEYFDSESYKSQQETNRILTHTAQKLFLDFY